MTLADAGTTAKVSRRYQYGPADDALFDQAYDTLGQATGLLEPLGDHQGSTRVVLGHQTGGQKRCQERMALSELS